MRSGKSNSMPLPLKFIIFHRAQMNSITFAKANISHLCKQIFHREAISLAQRANFIAYQRYAYTQPCAIIASATLRKPAMFAPATRSSPRPYLLAALTDASKMFFIIILSFASTSSAVQE